MNSELLNTLVKKKLIRPGTAIEATYLAPGLDGSFREEVNGLFTVNAIILDNSNKIKHLSCIRESDTAQLNATFSSITRIDGMDPAELGNAFDILPNGKMKKVKLDEFGMPVRRGRKPKNRRQGITNDRNNKFKKLPNSNTAKKSSTGERAGTSEVTKKTGRCKPKNRKAC